MSTQLRPIIPFMFLILCSSITPICSFNITKILAEHPEFSTFNHYLTATHLAGEINRRKTITVLAVSNSGMASVFSKHLSLYTLKNLLSLHVLVDYFGAKQLHQLTRGTTLSSTVFQATGAAPGTTGFVNITLHRAGRVFFSATDSGGSPPVSFVKSINEIPYVISVIQISSALSSPEAEAPTPAPADINITTLMATKGCKIFADLLVSTAGAAASFSSNAGTGLSAFCPVDQAIDPFLPLFKNLTAGQKLSLLLYHALPAYYSVQMLKSNNGALHTLATEGTKKNYILNVQNDGEVVTLKSKVVTAKITGTLIDEDPLAVYTIDEVLKPRELFKPAELPVSTPSPAPASDAAADSPQGGKKKQKHKHTSPPPAADVPADSPDDEPSDQKADDQNGCMRGIFVSFAGKWIIAVVAVTSILFA